MGSREVKAGGAYVEITARDRLAAGLQKAQKQLTAFSEAAARVGTAAIGGAAAVLGGLAAASMPFVAAGAALDDMAQRTGAAVEALSGLAYAAEQSGASIKDVELAMKSMAKTVYGDAQTAAEAFHMLGLSQAELQKQTTEEQFLMIAEALSKISDPGQRAALAMAVFGKGAMALLPLLEDGRAGIEQMMERARQLGLVMSAEDAAAAAEFDDALSELKGTLGAASREIAVALLPAMTTIAQVMVAAMAAANQYAEEHREVVVAVAAAAAAVGAFGVATLAASQVAAVMATALAVTNGAAGALRAGVIATAGAFGLWNAAAAAGTAISTAAAAVQSVLAARFAALTTAIAASSAAQAIQRAVTTASTAATAAYQTMLLTTTGTLATMRAAVLSSAAAQSVMRAATIASTAAMGALKTVVGASIAAHVVFRAAVLGSAVAAGFQRVALIGSAIAARAAALGQVLFGAASATASVACAAATAVFGGATAALGALAGAPVAVTIALGALAAYFIYTSGAIGDSMTALGSTFETLKSIALPAFDGIRNALKAEDYALAAKILWQSLQLAWVEGTAGITSTWEGAKAVFLNSVDDMLTRFRQAWTDASGFVADVLLKIYGMIDKSFDVEGAIKMRQEDSARTNKAIGDASKERQRERMQAGADSIQRTQDEIKRLREELNKSLQEAADKVNPPEERNRLENASKWDPQYVVKSLYERMEEHFRAISEGNNKTTTTTAGISSGFQALFMDGAATAGGYDAQQLLELKRIAKSADEQARAAVLQERRLSRIDANLARPSRWES